jgi:hypothetical protein
MAGSLGSYRQTPPFRPDPSQPDTRDAERLQYAKAHWHSQDEGLRRRDRQIEENIRMIAGQQYSVYNPWQQRWIDVSDWMTDDEKRWRQRPVVNMLLYWYMLTHSRLTENLPIVAFQPSSPDRFDAMLAEVMDTVFKSIWRDAGMTEVNDLIHAWMIVAGTAFAISRVDLTRGDLKPWVGQGDLQLLDPYGRPTGITRSVGPVPFDATGQPLARLSQAPDGTEEYEVTGQPHYEREGMIGVDVLSPLQVRGEWGPSPWHLKRWHACTTFLPCETVKELYGVEVEPDTFADEFETSGEVFRVLLGAGYYGAAEGRGTLGLGDSQNREGLIRVQQLWQAPCQFPGMEEREDYPGGRLLITTKTRVLRDGPRPAAFRYTSPIRRFNFVNLPGRPGGTTPQEMLNSIQRTINRGWAQILEHRNLVTNPIGIVDQASGLGDIQPTNKPGQILVANMRQGVEPMVYVAPPQLSEDVYKTQMLLEQTFEKLGHLQGSEGEAPSTTDPSGELVKELRFNSDRFIGATPKRSAEEYGRLVEDWIAITPTIWPSEKIIAYAGEDSIVKTITVLPEMFTHGRVNVVPDVESMLPEGRGEKQKQVLALYDRGVWGPPGTPQAAAKLMEMARFPHLGRMARPGGADRIMAEQENNKLVQGAPALEIPVFEWYDSLTHLAVHEEFMKSPEFLKLPEPVQTQFMLHRMAHVAHAQMMMAQMMAQQAAQSQAQNAGKGGPPAPGGDQAQPQGPPSEGAAA